MCLKISFNSIRRETIRYFFDMMYYEVNIIIYKLILFKKLDMNLIKF